MQPDASLILPVTAANPLCFYAASVALRTLRHTAPRLETLVFLNNTPPGALRDDLIDQCRRLDIALHDWTEPFSMSAIYNAGARLTSHRHLLYGAQDIIFYGGWLEPLIEAAESRPEYRILWPRSADKDFGAKSGLAPSGYPCGALSLMRRADAYAWDERFTRWELDADLAHEMRTRGWQGACVLDSRVDHLVESVDASLDYVAHYGAPRSTVNACATATLKAKWGLP